MFYSKVERLQNISFSTYHCYN